MEEGQKKERSEGGRKQPTTVVSMMVFTFCLWAESFKTIVKNPPPPAPAKEQPARSKQPDEVKGGHTSLNGGFLTVYKLFDLLNEYVHYLWHGTCKANLTIVKKASTAQYIFATI